MASAILSPTLNVSAEVKPVVVSGYVFQVPLRSCSEVAKASCLGV